MTEKERKMFPPIGMQFCVEGEEFNLISQDQSFSSNDSHERKRKPKWKDIS